METSRIRAGLRETLRMALATINERRVRSALTLLGIAVGTTTVIVIGSVLTGMGQRVTDIANNFGPNVLLVSKYDSIGPRFQARSVSERTRKNLTVSDVEAINALPSVDGASPQVQLGNFDPSKSGVSVKYEGTEYSRPLVSGVDANFADVRSLKIEEGRFLAAAEERRRARLVVIPSAAVQHLFGGLNPIDKEIQLDGLAFRVVGVRERSVGGLFGGESMDDRIFYVPYRTLETLHPELDDISISVKARDGQLDVATSEITEVLRLSRGRRRRRRRQRLLDPRSLKRSLNRSADSGHSALVVVPISGAGLLVGGVGVMNILLVSVLGTDLEIGVRRAVEHGVRTSCCSFCWRPRR